MFFIGTTFRSHSIRLKILPSSEIWQYFVTWMWTMSSGQKPRERNRQFLYILGSFCQRCTVLHLAGVPAPLKSAIPHNWLSDIALEASHIEFQWTNKCCLVYEGAACISAIVSGCIISPGKSPSGIFTKCWSHLVKKPSLRVWDEKKIEKKKKKPKQTTKNKSHILEEHIDSTSIKGFCSLVSSCAFSVLKIKCSYVTPFCPISAAIWKKVYPWQHFIRPLILKYLDFFNPFNPFLLPSTCL